MKRMNINVLKRLENIQSNIQITLYLPLLPGPQNTAKNVSTLHHAVALLKKTFDGAGVPKSNQQSIAEHITHLENELAHPMGGKSLAIFITDTNDMIAYELGFEAETAIYFMAPNMQLEPLKQHYQESKVYWVLALSQKGCQLFKGNGDSLAVVDAQTIGLDMSTVLRLDEAGDSNLQDHSIGTSNGRVTEGFHGQGGFKDVKKKYLQTYLREIDKRLSKYIRGEQAPIILLGVDYTQSLFRKVSNRKQIVASKVSFGSNPTTINAIQQAVMPLVKEMSLA